MKQLYKFRSKLFLYITLTVVISTQTWITAAADMHLSHFYSSLTFQTDTSKPALPLPATSASDSNGKQRANIVSKELLQSNDTIPLVAKNDTFALRLSKDSMDAPLKYEAADSAVILIVEKKVILYGKTRTEFKDITLEAPKVEVNQQTQIVTAYNSKDSAGEVIETAHFKSGNDEFTSDTLMFNFKNQIGYTKNTYTQKGDYLVIAKVSKKVNENTTFVQGGTFTTCLLDVPHFGIKTNKMKIINQKLAISGPAHLEFEEVPIPIYLPFGFYPLSQGRHSGLLRPEFVTDEVRGIGLQGFGYYKTLGDHWDAEMRGELYSYGEWASSVRTTYRKRYKYSGGFNLSYRVSKQNFKGDPDFNKSKVFNITWNHSMDSKARPGITFSANVNAGSTKYNRSLPGNIYGGNQGTGNALGGNSLGYTPLNYQDRLGSSITFSKTWKDKPFNLTVSANHSQDNNLRLINVNLPNAAFTVNTLYPFQAKNGGRTDKWYDKLGIAYNGNFNNSVAFYDSASYGKNGVKPFWKYLLDTAVWTSQHSIPVTLSLPPILGGKIIVSPGINYSQTWIQRVTNYQWNSTTKRVDTIRTRGFFIDQVGGLSLSFNTALFGTYQFKKTSTVKAIRHVIRPQMGFNYTPDLNIGHIKSRQVDTTGRVIYYNEIGGNDLYYAATRKSAAISFGIDNNLEMKKRSKNDSTAEGDKKVKLIDGFGFNGSYNMIADSFRLSPISFYFRTTLFDKISINGGTSLNPYQMTAQGAPIPKYAWEGGKFSLGKLTTGNLSISTNFQSKPKDPKKEEARKKAEEDRYSDPTLQGDQKRLLEYMQQNPSEFVDFNIEWQVSLSYSLNFYNRPKSDYSGFETILTSGLNYNGSFNLTPKWKLSSGGNFDFDTKKIQYLTLAISREMHCWQLNINVIPVGYYRSFNFSISPKASILQDLKINRTRNFTSY